MLFSKWWRYKNIIFFAIGIVTTVIAGASTGFHEFLLSLGNWGYLGALIGGVLFVSSFTSSIGTIILLILAERISVLEISIIAAIGGVIGDFTIFRIIKDDLLKDFMPIYNKLGGKAITRFFQHRYLKWSVPVLGAIIIASPLPDELGVTLMGLSGIRTFGFLIFVFILNAVGIFVLLSAV